MKTIKIEMVDEGFIVQTMDRPHFVAGFPIAGQQKTMAVTADALPTIVMAAIQKMIAIQFEKNGGKKDEVEMFLSTLSLERDEK